MFIVLKKPVDFVSLHAAHTARYPFLLESVASSEQARYDILFAFPQTKLVLHPPHQMTLDGAPVNTTFLNTFEQCWQTHAAQTQAPQEDPTFPFSGGWFIYLSYEFAHEIEPSLTMPQHTTQPMAYAVRIPAALIYDHQTGHTIVFAEHDDSMIPRIQADINTLSPQVSPSGPLAELQEDDPAAFLQGVETIKRYILEGDVFQVNLSRAWQGTLHPGVNATDIYRSLRQTNPAPFAGLATFAGHTICSSSPERLVCVRKGWVQTRPIAGTRPRSQQTHTDQNLAQSLLAHPKERAEHIMLIDLARNDLGRLCQPGSIQVDEFMVLESYAHVHHIVSNIQGQLRQTIKPSDVIAATFPGGTITGCPKVRCMQIIAALEQQARSAYTGSMGYINHDGSMDLNILIRSLSITHQQCSFRAGAGIVADSDPIKELEETRAKAKGMIQCLH